MSEHSRYVSPFSQRYASGRMQEIFSDDNKFRLWRRLWIYLAQAEQALEEAFERWEYLEALKNGA